MGWGNVLFSFKPLQYHMYDVFLTLWGASISFLKWPHMFIFPLAVNEGSWFYWHWRSFLSSLPFFSFLVFPLQCKSCMIGWRAVKWWLLGMTQPSWSGTHSNCVCLRKNGLNSSWAWVVHEVSVSTFYCWTVCYYRLRERESHCLQLCTWKLHTRLIWTVSVLWSHIWTQSPEKPHVWFPP